MITAEQAAAAESDASPTDVEGEGTREAKDPADATDEPADEPARDA